MALGELFTGQAGLVGLGRRLVLSVRVWLWCSILDQQLAAGADPGARPELSLRAAQLVRPRNRRRLARSAERLVAEYDAHRGWWLSAAIPFLRDQVGEARGTLLLIAANLRSGAPVAPRGVAMLSLLLTDPTSPLYLRTARGALQLKAHTALDYLAVEQPELPPTESALLAIGGSPDAGD